MRRFKQEISQDECTRLLETEKRAVLAVNGDGGYPYAMTINYYYDRDSGKIYFHGAKSGHKLDAIKNNNKICLTVCEQGQQRDDWSYYARSVIVFGKIRIIEDVFESTLRVRELAKKYYPADSESEIEESISRHIGQMYMFEISPEHISGKLVHEK
ncbi:MAG: pyridoxamine 5'-phosphate oxidase family protein [Clostridia bacterium]|nr:pyridoxamine 5'-phosphate oxidase family protein [Clostridia bacterium]